MVKFFVRTLTLPKVQIIEADGMRTNAGTLELFSVHEHGSNVVFASNARDWFSCQPIGDFSGTAADFEEEQLRGIIAAEKRAADIRHAVYPERYAAFYPVLPSKSPDDQAEPIAAK